MELLFVPRGTFFLGIIPALRIIGNCRLFATKYLNQKDVKILPGRVGQIISSDMNKVCRIEIVVWGKLIDYLNEPV